MYSVSLLLRSLLVGLLIDSFLLVSSCLDTDTFASSHRLMPIVAHPNRNTDISILCCGVPEMIEVVLLPLCIASLSFLYRPHLFLNCPVSSTCQRKGLSVHGLDTAKAPSFEGGAI